MIFHRRRDYFGEAIQTVAQNPVAAASVSAALRGNRPQELVFVNCDNNVLFSVLGQKISDKSTENLSKIAVFLLICAKSSV
jgi:hypothetical protein